MSGYWSILLVYSVKLYYPLKHSTNKPIFYVSDSFAINPNPNYKLILAANRDEFFERPTEKAAFWDQEQNLLAGKDLQQGGTWLGLTKQGRFSAVTNYRPAADRYFLNDQESFL